MNLNQENTKDEDILSTVDLRRSHEKFCTGSSYVGEWDECKRMHGWGVYRFPNGTEYHGQFKHGIFHGEGDMIFPNMYKVRARWQNGKMVTYEIVFPDDLVFVEKDWKYCTKGDRRYAACIRDGIPPVGDGYLTKDKIPRPIPSGCYDTEEGFYNPKKGILYSVENPNLAVRVPSSEEDDWIINNCRKAEDVCVERWRAYDIIQDMKEQNDYIYESTESTEQSDYTSAMDLMSEYPAESQFYATGTTNMGSND